jgi:carbonic anhydrase/acetyltransferase-like protein (isoleucine patch superfamily)
MDWIEIGERSNVQDSTVLHTDLGYRLVVGDGVTVGHKAMLHGCKIGDNTLIGIGSIILNGATIGKNCVIGAHTLVTKNQSFPDGSLILGSPARFVRNVGNGEIDINRKAAARYVANAELYRDQFAKPQA